MLPGIESEGVGLVTSGADPDEMSRSATCHRGLHCLFRIVCICSRYSDTLTHYHICSKICVNIFFCPVLSLKVFCE